LSSSSFSSSSIPGWLFLVMGKISPPSSSSSNVCWVWVYDFDDWATTAVSSFHSASSPYWGDVPTFNLKI
jgi:hypothetical protein